MLDIQHIDKIVGKVGGKIEMENTKTDPRVLRTRKLIMDAFIELSSQKEFKDITIKDITTEAMINRATFYYHFEDIYDLLEKVLSEVLLVNLNSDCYENDEINEKAFVSIFIAITNFQGDYPADVTEDTKTLLRELLGSSSKSFFTKCC